MKSCVSLICRISVSLLSPLDDGFHLHVAQERGELSEAEQLFRRALAFTEAEYGERHAETAITIDNLAQVLEEKGDFDEAEALFRRALAIAESTLEADNPSRAIVINNLALVLESKGQYDEAVGLYRNALAIFEAALGPEHAYTRDAEVRPN